MENVNPEARTGIFASPEFQKEVEAQRALGRQSDTPRGDAIIEPKDPVTAANPTEMVEPATTADEL